VSDLGGARIALLEARRSNELAALVLRNHGEPHCFPAVREETRECGAEVAALLEALKREGSSIFVLSTGVGVDALFAEARRLGRDEELKQAVGCGIAVCRGPKPAAALRRVRLAPAVSAKAPFTTDDLLEALAGLQLAGCHVVVLHYGEPNLPLIAALSARGARVRELLLYEWRLPVDQGPLRSLVDELPSRRFDAVAFTSQVQARHLFQVAAEMDRDAALREALRAEVVVAAVGPTCAHALEELGAPPHVVPRNPKMAAMIEALAEHLSQKGGPA
jgi:uroporphyrinogen-III synthase